MKHAEVKVDGMLIPLIGIPPDATLEECDLCHDIKPIWELTFNGQQFLCERCSKQTKGT